MPTGTWTIVKLHFLSDLLCTFIDTGALRVMYAPHALDFFTIPAPPLDSVYCFPLIYSLVGRTESVDRDSVDTL